MPMPTAKRCAFRLLRKSVNVGVVTHRVIMSGPRERERERERREDGEGGLNTWLHGGEGDVYDAQICLSTQIF